jgi:hypothetical protein
MSSASEAFPRLTNISMRPSLLTSAWALPSRPSAYRRTRRGGERVFLRDGFPDVGNGVPEGIDVDDLAPDACALPVGLFRGKEHRVGDGIAEFLRDKTFRKPCRHRGEEVPAVEGGPSAASQETRLRRDVDCFRIGMFTEHAREHTVVRTHKEMFPGQYDEGPSLRAHAGVYHDHVDGSRGKEPMALVNHVGGLSYVVP